MKINLKKLRALAKKATKGEWTSRESLVGDFVQRNPSFKGLQGNIARTYSMTPHDARYIAAARPEVVLTLIERLESAEKLCAAALAWIDVGVAKDWTNLIESADAWRKVNKEYEK